MHEQRKMPGWMGAIIGGMLVFILLSNFINLSHVAEELVLVGGLFGILLYASGGLDVVSNRMEGGRSGW